MPVRQEIKSQLAKLLATEDLIVEHKNVETAQFNVHTRVLLLPLWEKASNNVYDMLVGHEVGHALYTPDEWDWLDRIPQNFVNVVEDARIEKLMKRRYPGLAKTFYTGYNELHDKDFFKVDGEDLSNFNLADRANLYYKIGSFLPISFSSTEKPIIDLINDCETFTETLSAAEALYNFCKQEHKTREKAKQDSEHDLETDGDSSDDLIVDNMPSLPDSDGSDTMEGGSDSDASDIRSDTIGSDLKQGGTQSNFDDEPQVETVDNLEDAIRDLVDNRNNTESTYVELPKVDLKHIIIDNDHIHSNISTSFRLNQKEWDEQKRVNVFGFDLFEETDNEYLKFKRSAQKEVSYLVKEFECKKSADAYARATTARTGILDTGKLHTYKFNEDLFKKVSVVPDGKNHGLVFVLDWSGSMNQVMLDTVKQLYNLLWFCKKVNIPFEVYAFTTSHPPMEEGGYHKIAHERKEGGVLIEENFTMMNLFTSKVNAKDLDEQMKNIFRIASAFNRDWYCPFNIPIGMNLSGTPLNEALVSLHQILPQFKKENGLQKVQCIILTDGEAAPLRYSKKFQRDWESEPYWGSRYISDRCVVRNRKTGHNYSCHDLGHWADVTDLLLKDFRQTFLDMNFIGIRVMGSRDAGQFVRRYAGYEGDGYNKIMSRWKKEKSFAIKNSGYHTYFGLSSSALANDDEFDVQEDATKAQIKRAFVKSLKTKKMNKKILGEFIELVV